MADESDYHCYDDCGGEGNYDYSLYESDHGADDSSSSHSHSHSHSGSLDQCEHERQQSRGAQVAWLECGAYEGAAGDDLEPGDLRCSAGSTRGCEQAQLLELRAKLTQYEAEITQLRAKVEAQNRLLLDMQAMALNDVQPQPHVRHGATESDSGILLPCAFDVRLLAIRGGPSMRGAVVDYSGGGGTGKLVVQTPVMVAPFGVDRWDSAGSSKFDVQVSFDGMERSEPMQAFFAMLEAIDAAVLDEAVTKGWCGSGSRSAAEQLYTKNLRYRKDKDTGLPSTRFAPTFKMLLPHKDGRFLFPVFDEARQEVDLASMVAEGHTKGMRAQAIMQLTGVWFMGSKFGLSWKVTQLKVCSAAAAQAAQGPQPLLSGYAFQDLAS